MFAICSRTKCAENGKRVEMEALEEAVLWEHLGGDQRHRREPAPAVSCGAVQAAAAGARWGQRAEARRRDRSRGHAAAAAPRPARECFLEQAERAEAPGRERARHESLRASTQTQVSGRVHERRMSTRALTN